MDPIPHTAIEAKLFSTDMNYVIIGSNVDGVKDTYTDKECVWVNPYYKNNFVEGILRAIRISNKERQSMNESNKKSLSMLDYTKTIKDFLKEVNFI
jgi:trehalose-6-phosphate synthase